MVTIIAPTFIFSIIRWILIPFFLKLELTLMTLDQLNVAEITFWNFWGYVCHEKPFRFQLVPLEWSVLEHSLSECSCYAVGSPTHVEGSQTSRLSESSGFPDQLPVLWVCDLGRLAPSDRPMAAVAAEPWLQLHWDLMCEILAEPSQTSKPWERIESCCF